MKPPPYESMLDAVVNNDGAPGEPAILQWYVGVEALHELVGAWVHGPGRALPVAAHEVATEYRRIQSAHQDLAAYVEAEVPAGPAKLRALDEIVTMVGVVQELRVARWVAEGGDVSPDERTLLDDYGRHVRAACRAIRVAWLADGPLSAVRSPGWTTTEDAHASIGEVFDGE